MTEFTGFPSPTRNFFSLPNEMINIIASIKNLAELKVIIYVIRHTWGFHEYGIAKAISTLAGASKTALGWILVEELEARGTKGFKL